MSETSPQPDTKSEYEFCQRLLIENISILEKTEVYATGAIAATFAFSASAQEPFVAKISATIPIYIAIIGYLRWRGLDSTIKTINDYLEVLGAHLPDGGWTKYYRANRGPELRRSRMIIWSLLITLTIMFFNFTMFLGPFTKPEKPSRTLVPSASKPLTPNSPVPQRGAPIARPVQARAAPFAPLPGPGPTGG